MLNHTQLSFVELQLCLLPHILLGQLTAALLAVLAQSGNLASLQRASLAGL